MRGEPVVVAPHEIYSDATLLWAKLALLPAAYAATALSALKGAELPPKRLAANAYSDTSYIPLLPLAFALDWWKTLYWLARRMTPDAPGASPQPGGGADPGDVAVGIGPWTLPAFVTLLRQILSPAAVAAANSTSKDVDGPTAPPAPGERLTAAFSAFASQAWRTAQTGFDPGHIARPAGGARRRWRAKS